MPGIMLNIGLKDINVDEGKRGVLSLRYPIEHGIINNCEDME